MTDKELVKRLRGWAMDIQQGSTAVWAMDQDLKEAAAAIEALTAERDEALNQLDSATHSVEVLEKRVAEFMADNARLREALDETAPALPAVQPFDCECGQVGPCKAQFCAPRAALKGETP